MKVYRLTVETETKEVGAISGDKSQHERFFSDENKAIEYARSLGPTRFTLGDWHESGLTNVNFAVQAFAIDGRKQHEITILEIETLE